MIAKVELRELDVVTVVDPAISEKVTAARTSIVTVGVDPKQRIFIFPTIAARLDPTELISRTISEATRYQSRMIGIESVAYQRSLGHYIEKEMMRIGRFWPVRMLKPDRLQKKEARIRGRLHGYFASRQVYCSAGDYDLLREYEEFPNGRTNDILDALAYAPELWQVPDAKPEDTVEKSIKDLPPEDQRYWRSYHRKKRGEGPEDELDAVEEETKEEIGIFELFQ